ncbi:coproporphyrinogen dehydrogenase HemZ [Alkaliphilus serpentinus]|uniref:Coproporphyrinogen dehydrogenase HemZ n=1 Tax=Alkaliphilus serpentinus TaxID=1482731 RepID=A0A833HMK8_9FIRM|nr:coproporphyrinogen dehydrogenase HemZ [Alkaliphilus serpentinus]KAB3527665.1 coproporphyrinogen dehydrogenase HemZ [Alkaliphilus serpentinus]
MINVVCIGHDYSYELIELLKLSYRPDEIILLDSYEGLVRGETFLKTIIKREKEKISVSATLMAEGYNQALKESFFITEEDPHTMKKECKLLLKRLTYKLFSSFTNKTLPWGILTGIRPTKIVHDLMEKGNDEKAITEKLLGQYFLEMDKANLLLDVAKREHPIIYPIREDLISLYISIPFCPSRCTYCSFPSNILEKSKDLQQPYLDALIYELEQVAAMVNNHGKRLQTIYVGGGTPSTLTVVKIQQLLKAIQNSFNLSELKEFTFEAGRPDTINEEKLIALRDMGITRISINPQTMNDGTLQAVGRNHTVKELEEAYHLAKRVGFDNINMDLIIGLPGENPTMIEKTMERIQKLNPVSLTVHTLALKRASKLKEEINSHEVSEGEGQRMLEITKSYAAMMELKPYYMYRQKHMLGHLENIGYCKDGYEGIYNIQIMEEKQTIIALGAGAVSKMVYPSENRLERVPNVKNLQDYIERVGEMVERKKVYFP